MIGCCVYNQYCLCKQNLPIKIAGCSFNNCIKLLRQQFTITLNLINLIYNAKVSNTPNLCWLVGFEGKVNNDGYFASKTKLFVKQL